MELWLTQTGADALRMRAESAARSRHDVAVAANSGEGETDAERVRARGAAADVMPVIVIGGHPLSLVVARAKLQALEVCSCRLAKPRTRAQGI
jgi:hypothetical protein